MQLGLIGLGKMGGNMARRLRRVGDIDVIAYDRDAAAVAALADEGVRLIGVEAAGHGLLTDKHAASLTGGRPGVLHGNKTYLLQDPEGQIIDAHSISAGLDYPGIGPEHSFLHDAGRAQYISATDDEALEAFQLCAELEGIIPALESAHAMARLGDVCKEVGKDGIVVLLLSGRRDKDIFAVAEHLGRKI